MARFTKSLAAGVFVSGAVVGAAFALLYAPRSGVQTRKDIRRFTKRTVHRIDDLQEDIRDHVNDWVEDLSYTVKDGLNRGKRLSSHGYEQVMGVFENAKQYVENGKNRLEKMIKTA